ncbi:hypothetical protein D9758_003908 [Tetrapyrgos nigripes]|uniref:Smr domain-containing protein n=1 Tax=Tetrapyrgos nigripes TaxID=182062 RepID=A0A8H5LRK9_9AGAR|nr:hypothetical protein D9758_003908 [Tetrapyrgos nigripes]
MHLAISFITGLALRYLAPSSSIGIVILGAWEGVCLYYLSSSLPSSYDPHLAYALRLCFDLLLTRSPLRVFLILLWSLLSNFASDALSDQHFYDTTRSKHHRRVTSPAPVRRHSSARVISLSSAITSSSSSTELIRSSPPSSTRSPLPVLSSPDVTADLNIGESAGFSEELNGPPSPALADVSYPDTAQHVPHDTVFSMAENGTSAVVMPDDFEPSLPVLVPRVIPSIIDPLPPLHEEIESIDAVGMSPAVRSFDSPQDELQTPVLTEAAIDMAAAAYRDDELSTPLPRSMLLSTATRAPVEETASTSQAGQAAVAPPRLQTVASGSNSPIPVPAPLVGTSVQTQLVASPVDSDLPVSEPAQNFARAENLRDQAWKEVEFQKHLKLELEKATQEGNTKEAFMLTVDLEESRKRIFSLHSRARRRYLLARNHESVDGIVDVHGLLVPEAIEVTELAFRDALKNGKNELQVIVGKGKHSQDKLPKLKPAISRAMKKHGIECVVNPRNTGILLLSLPV